MTSTGSIPDFVKKLFNMLEENTYPHVFSWGKDGDTFVVKDNNEFSRLILPRHFKHSNFASFVRQLNKYDFHKLRLPEDAQRIYGDQAWEFQHPNFKFDRRDLLDEIKRKPSGKSSQNSSNTTETSTFDTPEIKSPNKEDLKCLASTLQKEIHNLKETQKDMTDKLKGFEQKYNTILRNVEGFRKNMVEQDVLMKDIMGYMSKQTKQEQIDQGLSSIIHQYNDITHVSQSRLDRISSSFTAQKRPLTPSSSSSPSSSPSPPTDTSIVDAATIPSMLLSDPPNAPVGLMASVTGQTSLIPTKSLSRKKRRLQPGWSIPPRVLLVDDDSLFRRLSTKLLQMAGCTIDVAVDGEEAVTKLGTGRYDLVLMDIMMPKLDGMSATRNIRQYDTLTPIISMTSNTTEQDIQQYILSGMTDVLPKPLNQSALGSLLERYCAHLVIQRHQQQQMHLLQQNFSLNNSLIDLNMTPQLTLLDEETEEGKGKGKEINNVQYLTYHNNQLMYTPQSTSIIPSTSYVPTQQTISDQPWFLYQNDTT